MTGFSPSFKRVSDVDWIAFQLAGENEAVLDIYGAYSLSLSNNTFERNWSTFGSHDCALIASIRYFRGQAI